MAREQRTVTPASEFALRLLIAHWTQEARQHESCADDNERDLHLAVAETLRKCARELGDF